SRPLASGARSCPGTSSGSPGASSCSAAVCARSRPPRWWAKMSRRRRRSPSSTRAEMSGAVSRSQAQGAPPPGAGETSIHPTAIVEDPGSLGPGARVAAHAFIAAGALIGAEVTVGPGVVVEPGVSVGAGTRLLAGTVLHAGAQLGASCTVGPYAVIAGEPMDTAFRGEPSGVVIEDEVVIREFVTV